MSITHVRTYDQVGKKEVVADVISMITPTKTPFQTSIKTESVKNTVYQWLEDSLRNVTDNAVLEGADAVDDATTQPVIRDNTTQILTKTFKVSGTADVISLYGRAKETAHQLMKAGFEVKRDLENALVGTGQAKALGNNSTVRKFAGVQAMINSGTVETAPDAVPGGSLDPSPLTEDLVLNVLQKVYNAGSEVDILMIKPSDALRVANFAYRKTGGNADRTREVGTDRKLVNAIDVYVSPWGEVRVVLNRFIRTTDAIAYDPANWRLVSLRPWFRQTLAITGDATRHQLLGEYGLKHKNFDASGLITNLS
jgi:hypothetical protein